MSPDLLLLVATMTSGVVTAALMNLKWVRVAQRVHYLPREVARLERLWFDRQPLGALWWGGAAILALTSVQGSAWLEHARTSLACRDCSVDDLAYPVALAFSWGDQSSGVDPSSTEGLCRNFCPSTGPRDTHRRGVGPCRSAHSAVVHGKSC